MNEERPFGILSAPPHEPDIPRLTVVVKGGRAGRTEGLDTPIDADGIAKLADWLGEHQGWTVVSAQAEGVTP